MRQLFIYIGRFFYCIFGWLGKKCVRAVCAFNTGYYTKGLQKVGKGVLIECPVSKMVGREFISVGSFTYIGKRSVITAWDISNTPKIEIGSNVGIGDDCHITSINKVIIGDGTLLGKKVTITDNAHGSSNRQSMGLPPGEREI